MDDHIKPQSEKEIIDGSSDEKMPKWYGILKNLVEKSEKPE